MRTLSVFVGCVGLLLSAVLVAADPPYAGRWKVNEDKTDYGPAFNFSPTESGELRLTLGERSYIVRFDVKEGPHPPAGWFADANATIDRGRRPSHRMGTS